MHTDYLMFYYLDSTHFIDEHYFSYFKKKKSWKIHIHTLY